MSSCVMEKLKSDLRMAEIEAKENYSASRSLLDSDTEDESKDHKLIVAVRF